MDLTSSTPAQPNAQAIRRVVILGHKGFIGGNLFRHFLAHSAQLEIVGRDFPEVDLTKPDQAKRLAEDFDPNTAVIICAAIKKQLGDTLEAFEKNLQIAVNVCRVLAKSPVKRVIFFSSAAVYGEDVHNTNITEDTPVQPATYYGIAKFTTEGLLRKTLAPNRTSLVCVRPALVYGPGDQGGYGPTGFIKAALAKEPIVLWGDGSEKREFVYVGDVARVVHALTLQAEDEVINLVSGTSYTFLDALVIVRQSIGLSQPVATRPRTKNKADHGFDNARLRGRVPGTFTSLSEGMRLTIESNRQPASSI
jgi:UDP-glucose 4-epimerase